MNQHVIYRLIIAVIFLPVLGSSQQKDTLKINASAINTKVLIPDTHRYLVYFKNGKDSSRKNYQFWSRKIEFVQYKGKDAVSVTQVWENNDTIFHTAYAVCDKKTFAPLYQESWFRQRAVSIFDFTEKSGSYDNRSLSDADTAKERKRMWDGFKTSTGQYVLDWHLDLEVFPTLPYKPNRTFLINFYDPGFGYPEWVAYTVSGTATAMGYNNQPVDCWLLSHDDGPGKHEVFWISKKTKEVIRLEQEFGGRFRYKIKLPFSN